MRNRSYSLFLEAFPFLLKISQVGIRERSENMQKKPRQNKTNPQIYFSEYKMYTDPDTVQIV